MIIRATFRSLHLGFYLFCQLRILLLISDRPTSTEDGSLYPIYFVPVYHLAIAESQGITREKREKMEEKILGEMRSTRQRPWIPPVGSTLQLDLQ